MNKGRSLTDLAAELERQVHAKKDFVAAQGIVQAAQPEEGGKGIVLAGLNGGEMAIRPHAHRQLATHLGIPVRYYDKMADQRPDMLVQNINGWFAGDPNRQRMIRTIDGEVRAFLSPSYRPLDNYDLASTVLPVLTQAGAEIVSAQLTETRIYIKAILPSMSSPLPEGMQWGVGHQSVAPMQARDGRIVAAVVICNSEVGNGALRVEPSAFTTWCTNLMVMAQASMRKFHIGRASQGDDNFEVLRDETREASDRAFWMQVEDVTRAAFKEDTFKAAIASIADAGKQPITGALPKVIEVAARELKLTETVAGGVLTHLAAGGDLTKWGLSSAITRAAEDQGDYEASTTLERLGGQVLALEGPKWAAIAEAA